MIQTKICTVCSREYSKEPAKSWALWDRQTTCSRPCYYERMRREKMGFKEGHVGYKNSGNFKSGHIPWNTGLAVKSNDALKKWRDAGGQPFFKGKKMPRKVKEKMKVSSLTRDNSNTPRKEKHWNWSGGVTPLRNLVMRLRLYRNWRFQVFKRDNFTCQECGKSGVYLNADHIKPFSKIVSDNQITTTQQAKRCAELWDISNGRTLCVSCHQKTNTYGSKSIIS